MHTKFQKMCASDMQIDLNSILNANNVRIVCVFGILDICVYWVEVNLLSNVSLFY